MSPWSKNNHKEFMKSLIRCMLALAFVAVAGWNTTSFAQFSRGGTTEGSGTLAILSDGTCSYTNVSVAPRAALEQQMRMMDRYLKDSETADDTTPPAADAKESETKPFTDEELIKKIEASKDDGETSPDEKLTVTITNGMVRMQTVRSFDSLEDMLRDGSALWESGVGFQYARFETETNGQIRVTFSVEPEMQRYFKTTRASLKLMGTKGEFRLILPGKILTSALPVIQGNTTSFMLDGKKDESLDAAAKLYEAPVVITAEAGGLKIPQPLDSKTIRRTNPEDGKGVSDLPLTDAGPGFVAESESITTSTLNVFPEGKGFFKEGSGQNMAKQTGATISAKIFAPKGRILQSISGVKVVKAVDDKGRTIAPAESDEGGEAEADFSMDSAGSGKSESLSIQLALGLPATDAQAINEVDAEAIAVTAGTWKTMSVTNLQATNNEIDLSAVLPGAKMIITKFTSKKNEYTIQAEIKGPPTVKRIDFQTKIPGIDQSNSSSNDRRFNTKAGISTRAIDIRVYNYSDQEPAGPMVLVVRYPEDLRRERLQIKLTGLDLF
jgi:hypothetical protein